MPSRIAAAGLLTAVAALWLVVTAGAAAAHTALRSSTPADGATVTVAPDRVVLRFTAELAEQGAAVQVTGPGGQVGAGAVAVDGDAVTQRLGTALADGAYTVRWRVAAGDGHPLSGVVRFTLRAGPRATPAPTSAAEPVPSATTAAVAPSPSSSSPAPDSGDGVPTAVWAGVAVAVLAGGGVLAAVRRERERGRG